MQNFASEVDKKKEISSFNKKFQHSFLSVPPVIILACYPTVFDKSAPSCIQVQRPFPQLASQKLRTNGTSYSYSYFYSWGQVFRCSRSYTVIDVHAEYTRQVLFHSKILRHYFHSDVLYSHSWGDVRRCRERRATMCNYGNNNWQYTSLMKQRCDEALDTRKEKNHRLQQPPIPIRKAYFQNQICFRTRILCSWFTWILISVIRVTVNGWSYI